MGTDRSIRNWFHIRMRQRRQTGEGSSIKTAVRSIITRILKERRLSNANMLLRVLQEELSKDFCEQVVEKYSHHNLKRPIYVIQEHHATRLHWDLRFEINNTLKSWALPKGVPKGSERRLAVQVDDHPIEYAAFEGAIPKGSYGAGQVKVFDRGTFKMESYEEDKKMVVYITGNKLKGRYCLLHFKPNEDNWLFFKLKD